MKQELVSLQKRRYRKRIRTFAAIDIYYNCVAHYLLEYFGHKLDNCENQELIDYVQTTLFEQLGLSSFWIHVR